MISSDVTKFLQLDWALNLALYEKTAWLWEDKKWLQKGVTYPSCHKNTVHLMLLNWATISFSVHVETGRQYFSADSLHTPLHWELSSKFILFFVYWHSIWNTLHLYIFITLYFAPHCNIKHLNTNIFGALSFHSESNISILFCSISIKFRHHTSTSFHVFSQNKHNIHTDSA